MTAIVNGTAALGFVLRLNWDRILYVAAVPAALVAGAWLGTILI